MGAFDAYHAALAKLDAVTTPGAPTKIGNIKTALSRAKPSPWSGYTAKSTSAPAAVDTSTPDPVVGPEELEAAYEIIREAKQPIAKDDYWAFWRPGNPAYDRKFPDAGKYWESEQGQRLAAAQAGRIKQIAEEL